MYLKKVVLFMFLVLFYLTALYCEEWQNYNTSNSSLPENSISTIYRDSYNNIWLAMSNYGIVKFNEGSFVNYTTENSGLNHNMVRSFVEDPSHNSLWIGSAYGLNNFNFDNQWQSYLSEDFTIYSLKYDNNGNLLIGTGTNGFYKYDGTNFYNYNTSNSVLPSNYVYDLYNDNGVIWLACFDGGIVKISQNNWTVYNTNNSNITTNHVKMVNKIQGKIWVTSDQGIFIYNENSDSFSIINTINSPLPSDDVRSLLEYDNYIWIGTFGGGLARLSSNNTWTIYNSSNSGLTDNYLTNNSLCIYNNKLLIGSYYGGLFSFDYNDIPNILADYTTGTSPLTVHFSLSEINNNYLYNWDFNNDGIIDDEGTNPQYTYEQAGIYSVRLVVNHNGEISERVFNNFITVNSSTFWNNPEVFPMSTTLLTTVKIEGESAASGDILAAFENYNGEEVIRGLSTITNNDSLATTSMIIYMENQSSNIFFKLLRVANNQIITSDSILTCTDGLNLGTHPDSLYLISFDGYNHNYDFSSGWSLFSINLIQDNYEINNIFNNNLSGIEVIKSDNQLYYPNYPENSLTTFVPGKAYWIKTNSNILLPVHGFKFYNPITTHLNSGWNLVGACINNNVSVENFFSSISQNIQEIKGIDGVYLPNNPLNTLLNIEPFKGYWVKVNNRCDLVYSPNLSETKNSPMKTNSSDIQYKPNSMIFTFKLNSNNFNENDQLVAYVNGEVRGRENVKTINNQAFSMLQVFTDTPNELITFKILQNNNELSTDYSTNSIPGSVVGNYLTQNYVTINTVGISEITSDTPAITLNSIYPNPFNPNTTIKYTISKDANVIVDIYNIKGQKVANLVNNYQKTGAYEITWNGKNNENKALSSGIYFCKLISGNKTINKKLTLVK